MIVPLISFRAAQEFFRPCDPLGRRSASLGEGGLSVSFSYVVCLERAFRGVPGCEGDVAGIVDEGGARVLVAAVGFVCSKKDC